jgi:acetyl esterase/lipase
MGMSAKIEGADAPTQAKLAVDDGGTIEVPAFRLPLSAALSPESRQMQTAMLKQANIALPRLDGDFTDEEFAAYIDRYRANLDAQIGIPFSQLLADRFPVEIEAADIAGVPVEHITPQGGATRPQILINLHGGGFVSGARYIGRIESIPVAHLGGWRVISVDYRQAYEHRFPAASEDVEAVYRALLKDHAPEDIGIYGGSAGGMLTAQATAWLLDKGLPTPGAIGIFGAGAGGVGDSTFFGRIGVADAPPADYGAPGDIWAELRSPTGYFRGALREDWLAYPQGAPRAFLAQYPPALLITGTRAFDMSPAILFHRALVQAGVEAALHVFDGMGHCFYYSAHTPEARDAYDTIVRFFGWHLGRR